MFDEVLAPVIVKKVLKKFLAPRRRRIALPACAGITKVRIYQRTWVAMICAWVIRAKWLVINT